MRDVPCDGILKLSVFAAGTEFCEWVQVGIDVCYPSSKISGQVSSPWFSAACAAAIAHRNHFRLYQQNKSFTSKAKFRQASNHYKRVLEAAKLSYANKI